MRARRLTLLFLALYLAFVGGAYYAVVFPVRVFHHVLLTLLFAAWLVGRVRRGEGLPRTPVNLPLYAAVAVWLVTAALGRDPRMALESVWHLLMHVLFFFALVDLFQRGRQRLVFEIQLLIAALVVFLSALELASWYFGLGFIPGTSVGWIDVLGPGAWLPLRLPRLSLAMSISTLVAAYVAPLVMLAVGWALSASRRSYRRALWALAAALLVVLVLTFSRGGLISLGGALATFTVLRALSSQAVTRRVPARVIIGGAALALLVVGGAIVAISANPTRQSGDEERLDMWRSAVAMTRDNPLLGVGPGQFGRVFREYRDRAGVQEKLASAHNLYLNVTAETGILGAAVGGWLLVAFLRAWWRRRAEAHGNAARIRLDTVFAALAGIALHSLVDVFTITPIVLLIALLAAYAVTGYRTWQDAPVPSHPHVTAWAALALVVGYGVWLVTLDVAQSRYQASMAGGSGALELARQAEALDPHLRLYDLQVAYLTPLDEAIPAYERALAIEPTWDVGWLNLAALREREGDLRGAMDALERAREITPSNAAALHWARIAEQMQPSPPDPLSQEARGSNESDDVDMRTDSVRIDDEAIVTSYLDYLRSRAGVFPTSDFWTQTPLRRAALEQYAEAVSPAAQYRLWAVHDLERAAALVQDDPQTSADYWIAGEHALTVEGDADMARAFFSEAIRLAPTVGDYYAARARTELVSVPFEARRDLMIAELLGTTYEYPAVIRVSLARDEDERRALQAAALPARALSGEVYAVLYGRPASFDVLPEMRGLSAGRVRLQPLYDLAESYAADGDTEGAARVYRAILDVDPYDSVAREAMEGF